MKSLRNNKGFTLVELAIVLVIIGIIIGAVLKGQELINNARHKKFINDAGRKFEVAAWTFFDRNGRFPGDSNKNGVIGDDNGDVYADLVTNSKILSDSDNPVTMGSYRFLVGLGNDGGTKRNVLVICPTSDGSNCNNTSITDDELEFFKAFDTAIDGTTDAVSGVVRGATGTTTFNSSKWIMTLTGIVNTSNWTSSTTALVYYFDRKP